MNTFYIENFGCRATQADGAALERQFLDRGLERAEAMRDAAIVVLNTCTVTEGADKDARASIRRVRRQNPQCRILVTGCYAQRAPEELASLPGVTWVVGNSHKHRAAEIATFAPAFVPLSRLQQNDPAAAVETGPNGAAMPEHPAQEAASGIFVSDIFAHTELIAAPVFDAANERTRPNLKVQDGCDNRCAFCVIPSVRGHSRSMQSERAIAEVKALVGAGYREVVISGINLGRWGRDLESAVRFRQAASESQTTKSQQRLVHLIRAILDQTDLEKLRISSVEPMDWSDELIDLVATSPRIAKHAHVPLQSASDAVLRRMHRKYRPWHYREKILKIRAAMPFAAIGADVMVGFPAETEAEFAATRGMVEELPFTYLHVFTYSERPGTAAATSPSQVPMSVARERNRILREFAAQKNAAFRQSLVGNVIEAITLQHGTSEYTDGLTDNYLKVRVIGQFSSNRWLRVRIEGSDGGALIGRALGD